MTGVVRVLFVRVCVDTSKTTFPESSGKNVLLWFVRLTVLILLVKELSTKSIPLSVKLTNADNTPLVPK